VLKGFLVSALACVWLVSSSVVFAESSSTASSSLSNWINEVLSNNPQLLEAQAGLDATEGKLQAAEQPLFNPELELDFERTDIDAASLGISQTFDWSNKRGARTAVANYEKQAATAGFELQKERLAADFLQALAKWDTANAVALVNKKQVSLMERFVSLAERRRQAGDMGQVELDLAHLAASEAAFQQSNAIEELIRSRQSLASLTGQDGSGLPSLDSSLPNVDPEKLDVEKLLQDLPSMRDALAQVSAARAGVKLKTREKRADPTIGIRVGEEDSETLGGLTFTVPLFVRNRFNAEVEVANAIVIQQSEKLEGLRRQLSASVLAAARIYQNARNTWTAWETSGAPRLNQRTELLDRLWQAGELRTTEYLVQLEQVLETEVSAIEQHGRMWEAWTDWLVASGQVEQWLDMDKSNNLFESNNE
jgi:cobalt-zinc-cadmium efflux system outer membrane protein